LHFKDDKNLPAIVECRLMAFGQQTQSRGPFSDKPRDVFSGRWPKAQSRMPNAANGLLLLLVP
jgi:hypothetical protein